MTGLTLQTRIRDAELSVRTANGLCSMYGEDVKFEHFVDPGPDELEMLRAIGRKGLKEFQEVLGYAREGSRALSRPPPIVEDSDYDGPKRETKTLRDEFAMAALTGLLSDPQTMCKMGKKASMLAYEIADGMMEARALRTRSCPAVLDGTAIGLVNEDRFPE